MQIYVTTIWAILACQLFTNYNKICLTCLICTSVVNEREQPDLSGELSVSGELSFVRKVIPLK